MSRFDLFGPPKFAGPGTFDEVAGNPRLCASIVGMFAAGMDTDAIGNRLVIPEHVIDRIVRIEREKQRTLA